MSRLPTRRSLTKVAIVAGTFVASVAVLLTLLYRERTVLLEYEWQLHLNPLIGSLILFSLALVLAAAVWSDLMRTLGSEMPAARHISYYCIANVAKRLPGTLWYVAGRGYLYKNHGESLRLVSIASSLELIVGLVSGIVVTLAFAGVSISTLSRGHIGILFGAFVLGLALIHPSSIRWTMRRIGVDPLPDLKYGSILKWVGVYTLIWIIGGTVLYLVANIIVPVDLRHVPYVISSWSLVGVLSILVFFLPTNLGITEAGLGVLLATVMPSSLAVVVAILTRVLLIAYELFGVLVITITRNVDVRRH